MQPNYFMVFIFVIKLMHLVQSIMADVGNIFFFFCVWYGDGDGFRTAHACVYYYNSCICLCVNETHVKRRF